MALGIACGVSVTDKGTIAVNCVCVFLISILIKGQQSFWTLRKGQELFLLSWIKICVNADLAALAFNQLLQQFQLQQQQIQQQHGLLAALADFRPYQSESGNTT